MAKSIVVLSFVAAAIWPIESAKSPDDDRIPAQILIQFLVIERGENSGSARVLNRQQIMTFENHTANVSLGCFSPITCDDSVIWCGGPPRLSVRLQLTPRMTAVGKVQMNMISEVTSPYSEIMFRNGNGAGGYSESALIAQEGQTILRQVTKVVEMYVETQKIGRLGDLPYVGSFFCWQRSRKLESRLFLALTPHIIRNAEDLVHVRQSEDERIDKMLRHRSRLEELLP